MPQGLITNTQGAVPLVRGLAGMVGTIPTVPARVLSVGTVIASGNEITDASRSLGVAGDGRVNVVSPQVTNLVPNGGLEAGIAYYSAVGSGVLTQQSTYARSGTYSGRVVCGALYDGTAMTGMGNLAPSTQYTASVELYHPTGGAVFFDATDNIDLTANNGASLTVPAATWTKYTFTWTTDAHVAWTLRLYSGAGAQTFYFDNLQCELGAVAHTYVETSTGVVTRAAVLQGNDSSFGVYPAAKNWLKGTNFSGVNGWLGNCGVGETLSVQAADAAAPFPNANVLKVVCDGTHVNQGCFSVNSTSHPAGSIPWSESLWARCDTGSVAMKMRWSDGVGITDTTFTLTPTWQKVTFTKTAAVSPTTLEMDVFSVGTVAFNLYLQGPQFEDSATVTPFMPSANGATATRAAARVQVPADCITPVQGWAVFRVRMGFPSAVVTNYPRLFTLTDGTTNNLLQCGTGTSSGHAYFYCGRAAAGVAGEADALNIDHVTGALMTVIPVWTPATLGISVNGSSLSTVANTSVAPIGLRSQIDIGSFDGTQQFISSEILWACFGTGTFSDADAARLAALGSTDPTPALFTPANQLTLLWNATDTSMLRAA